jgi:RimJ/RimL family protein N-acetyltransferase
MSIVARRLTEELTTERLVLTPLREDDAAEMVQVVSHAALYSFTNGAPPALEDLQSRYRTLVAGPHSAREAWHNWVVRLPNGGGAIGVVQATIRDAVGDVTWMIAPPWQRRGYATEAASAMCDWLRHYGVETITAQIHPEHTASHKVATAIGLVPTDEVDDRSDVIWRS